LKDEKWDELKSRLDAFEQMAQQFAKEQGPAKEEAPKDPQEPKEPKK
jgi:hypothetical protein